MAADHPVLDKCKIKISYRGGSLPGGAEVHMDTGFFRRSDKVKIARALKVVERIKRDGFQVVMRKCCGGPSSWKACRLPR